MLMQVKDEGEQVDFYVKNKSDKTISEFIISVNDPDETAFIRITGAFTMDDLRELIK